MEERLYHEILKNYKLALEFKKNTVGVFRGKTVKSLQELSEIFHETDGKYTIEEAREFILELSSQNTRWHYGSNQVYSNYLSFTSMNNKIKVRSNRLECSN